MAFENVSDDMGCKLKDRFSYRTSIGSIHYLFNHTKINLFFSVGVLERLLSGSIGNNFAALTKSFRYFVGTISTDTWFEGSFGSTSETHTFSLSMCALSNVLFRYHGRRRNKLCFLSTCKGLLLLHIITLVERAGEND